MSLATPEQITIARTPGKWTLRAITRGVSAAVLLAVPAGAAAQSLDYDRTALIHGIGSSPAIWLTREAELGQLTPAEYLGNRVWLKTVSTPFLDEAAPEPSKGNSAEQQRTVLASHLAARPGRFVLLAHSLGGIAARNVFDSPGVGAARVAGIATIASPHRGVKIADNGRWMARYVQQMERASETARRELRGFGLGLNRTLIGMLIGQDVVEQTRARQEFPDENVDALLQLRALSDLSDTSANIRRLRDMTSDGVVPRASVVGSIPYQHALLRLAGELSSESYEELLRKYHAGLKWLRTCREWTFIVPGGPARSCRAAIAWLTGLDNAWALTTNGADAQGRPRIIPGDGVVPHERSVYPSTFGELYTELAEGTNHLNVYRTQIGLERTASVLRRMRMQPPASPLGGLSVAGPTDITSSGEYTWSAQGGVGGDGVYAYEWLYRPEGTTHYSLIATGSAVSIHIGAGGAPFELMVRMLSRGQVATSSVWVTNSVREPGWCGYTVCYDQ